MTQVPLALGRLGLPQAALSVLDQAVVSGTSFVTSVIIGRLCSREDLGVYALALSVVLFLRGLQGVLVCAPYTIFCSRRDSAYTGSALFHYLFLTVVSTACFLGLASLLTLGVGPAGLARTAWVLAGAMPFLLLREFFRQVALAHLRLGVVVAIDLSAAVVQLGGLLLLGFSGSLTVPSAYAVIGVACGVACLGWLLAGRQPIRFARARLAADWRHNWVYGRWASASYLIGSTVPYLMPWVVAITLGEAATGLLAACVTLINCAGTYVTGVGNLLAPRAARAFAWGGRDDLRRVLGQAAALFTITLSVFAVLILAAGDLPAALVYGHKYVGTAPILAVLALNMLVNSLGITAGIGLGAMERPKANCGADLCTLAVTIGTVCCLVHSLGVFGAAVGILTGTSVGATVRYLTLVRVMKVVRSEGSQGGGKDA